MATPSSEPGQQHGRVEVAGGRSRAQAPSTVSAPSVCPNSHGRERQQDRSEGERQRHEGWRRPDGTARPPGGRGWPTRWRAGSTTRAPPATAPVRVATRHRPPGWLAAGERDRRARARETAAIGTARSGWYGALSVYDVTDGRDAWSSPRTVVVAGRARAIGRRRPRRSGGSASRLRAPQLDERSAHRQDRRARSRSLRRPDTAPVSRLRQGGTGTSGRLAPPASLRDRVAC